MTRLGHPTPHRMSFARIGRVAASRRTRTRHGLVAVGAAVGTAGLAACLLASASPASAAPYENSIDMGNAGAYSVIGGQTVTNTVTPTVLSDDLGVSPGSATTGFPPGTAPAIDKGNAAAAYAVADARTAYGVAKGRASSANLGAALVGGTHQPGVYTADSDLHVSGAVTLNGLGDPNAVFIVQVGGSMTTDTGTSIVTIGKAQACNVFWQIGASATLETSNAWVGTVMALTSISVKTDTTVAGRALALNGQVSLDDNVFTSAACHTTDTTTTVSATPVHTGGTTTVTATVAAPGAATPEGGTVEFTSNGHPVGSAPVDSNGKATLAVPVGTATTVNLVGTYTGLGSYGTSPASPPAVLTVTPVTAPASSTTAKPAPASSTAAKSTAAAKAPVTTAASHAATTTTSAAGITHGRTTNTGQTTTLAETGPNRLGTLLAAAAGLLMVGALLSWTGRRPRRFARHAMALISRRSR